jgi:sugar phosphate isomerase/epimerase
MSISVSLLVACQREAWSFVPSLARRHQLGVEVGDFADPELLEGDWRRRWQEIRPLVESVPGHVTLHGPRSDLNPGLRDRGLAAFCQERYRRALEVAAEIGADTVVFHTGYNPLIRAPGYDRRWTKRSAVFWQALADEAGSLGVGILLENLWEPRPEVQRDLIDTIGSPLVRACLDVGHSNAYSRQPVERWVSCLGERVTCVHLHNNDGRQDSHGPLEEGTVDFSRFLPLLLLSPQPPRLVLEVSGGRQGVEDSLFYLRRLLSLS